VRVLLADDHALFRAGIASLLGAWGLEVVGQAGDGKEAVDLARQLQPDLVLMDIGMPGIDGLQATGLIKAELPETKIVIVTASDEDADLFEAIKAGAEGYLVKGMSEQDFERVLQGVVTDEPLLSKGLAARVLDEFARLARTGPVRQPDDVLTRREREVLQLLASGQTNREIATALVISENTVGFHVKNILRKLHVENRAQAAVYATRASLAPKPGDRR
jgi:DNA-binding NarL/FixJ family response regulator